MKPYGLMADIHLHNWSAFSTTREDGKNSRLEQLLMEIERCADTVAEEGGDTLIIAGDLFHTRGSLPPSVLNPTIDLFDRLYKAGFKIIILAGNHDLEGKHSENLTSAVTTLRSVGCHVVNSIEDGVLPMDVVLVPWIDKVADLKETLKLVAAGTTDVCNKDLIIHAPIDGVIVGLPDHGLDADWLFSLGFNRVFSGHYHNHCEFDKRRVWSIGALAHHTWSDVGSKAGFLIVKQDTVKWYKSHAPEFVEITAATSMEDIPLLADGNYVRAKINSTKSKDTEELRSYLEDNGAAGVVILAQKEAATRVRGGSTITAGASMAVSVNDFIKAQGYKNHEKLALTCQDILNEVRGAE